jgi:5'-deoxynucleotidase YfbR-like HD superfamily hydrolase
MISLAHDHVAATDRAVSTEQAPPETPTSPDPLDATPVEPREDRSEPPLWAKHGDVEALRDLWDAAPGSEAHRAAVRAAWALDDEATAPARERAQHWQDLAERIHTTNGQLLAEREKLVDSAERAVGEARRWKAIAGRRKAERDEARGRAEAAERALAEERARHGRDLKEAWAVQSKALDERDDAQREVECAEGMEARALAAEQALATAREEGRREGRGDAVRALGEAWREACDAKPDAEETAKGPAWAVLRTWRRAVNVAAGREPDENYPPTVPSPKAAPSLTCYVCGAPATCYGRYEGHGDIQGGCDEHCGHGNEDGWCKPVPADTKAAPPEPDCEACEEPIGRRPATQGYVDGKWRHDVCAEREGYEESAPKGGTPEPDDGEAFEVCGAEGFYGQCELARGHEGKHCTPSDDLRSSKEWSDPEPPAAPQEPEPDVEGLVLGLANEVAHALGLSGDRMGSVVDAVERAYEAGRGAPSAPHGGPDPLVSAPEDSPLGRLRDLLRERQVHQGWAHGGALDDLRAVALAASPPQGGPAGLETDVRGWYREADAASDDDRAAEGEARAYLRVLRRLKRADVGPDVAHARMALVAALGGVVPAPVCEAIDALERALTGATPPPQGEADDRGEAYARGIVDAYRDMAKLLGCDADEVADTCTEAGRCLEAFGCFPCPEGDSHAGAQGEAAGPPEPVTIDHAIAIASAALTFGQVKRATLHPDGSEETDTTHTVMLAMVVADIARAEGLDVGLAVQFAVVHDLPETYAGDTCTARALSPVAAAAKAEREAASLDRLVAELGPCWSTSMVRRYEAQHEPEARLVKCADKILPKLTHILNSGRALAAIGMTPAESEVNHAAQGAKLRAAYPDFAATHALFDAACARSLAAMQAPASPHQGSAEPEVASDDALGAFQREHVEAAAAAGESMFLGLPGRWYEPPGPKWRCPNGHVRRGYIKSETNGALCPKCMCAVALTFPEDTEQPPEPHQGSGTAEPAVLFDEDGAATAVVTEPTYVPKVGDDVEVTLIARMCSFVAGGRDVRVAVRHCTDEDCQDERIIHVPRSSVRPTTDEPGKGGPNHG